MFEEFGIVLDKHTGFRRHKAEDGITQRRYLVGIEPCNVTEAAKTLGISPQTIRGWVSQRRIRHYRMGRKIVFNKHDLEASRASSTPQAVKPACFKFKILGLQLREKFL